MFIKSEVKTIVVTYILTTPNTIRVLSRDLIIYHVFVTVYDVELTSVPIATVIGHDPVVNNGTLSTSCFYGVWFQHDLLSLPSFSLVFGRFSTRSVVLLCLTLVCCYML